MINDINDLFVVLEKFDITMEQFMLPYILYLDQREHGEDPLPRGDNVVAYIYRYSENIRPWPRESIYDMVEKGLLENYNESDTVYPDNLEVTDKFAEAVFATHADFEMFWEEYPSFTENFNDERKGDIPLKASVKSDVKELFESMVTSKRDFRKLMEALQWAKKRDMVRMNIEKFLGSEHWKQLHEKMDETPNTGVTVI